jgi:hypothetical protein
LYTNGSCVYDNDHKMMTNGSRLIGNSYSTQSAIIVLKLRRPYLYCIFTVGEPNNLNSENKTSNYRDTKNNGLNYSRVEM